ncbi:MAG: hypothetical protein HC924_15385 [Synechococcaceae cyanobacterium SM2_3_2]|nr:hypothetical protein [Synechococcaceae cyanobacterium SM2_3_2]
MPIANEFAFPFQHHQKFSIHDPVVSSQGLSKQEMVAAMALQGMLSNPQFDLTQMGAEYRAYLVQSSAVLATELLQLLQDPYALEYVPAEAAEHAYASPEGDVAAAENLVNQEGSFGAIGDEAIGGKPGLVANPDPSGTDQRDSSPPSPLSDEMSLESLGFDPI